MTLAVASHQTLAYTFVVAWRAPWETIPFPADAQRFARELFDDPYSTELGADELGVIIAHPSGPGGIIEKVRLGHGRMEITSPSLDTLTKVYARIVAMVTAAPSDLSVAMAPGAYGFNSDHEWLTDEAVPEWLGRSTLSEDLRRRIGSTPSVRTVHWTSSHGGALWTVQLQPRVGKSGIFAHVNRHLDTTDDIVPSAEGLKEQLQQSAAEARQYIERILELEEE